MKAAKLIASCIVELQQAGHKVVIDIELLNTTLHKYGHFNLKILQNITQNISYNLTY